MPMLVSATFGKLVISSRSLYRQLLGAGQRDRVGGSVHLFRAPTSLPIITSSKFVPEKGFQLQRRQGETTDINAFGSSQGMF